MTDTSSNTSSYLPRTGSSSYYRLIALWVLNEAMFGGMIHGLRIPISGLVVGSTAVICICLIAWYVPAKGAIMKATIIVAIFKMMLSPQAPATAYIAVLFQGTLGELLFFDRRFFKLSCILLATLALLESGFQRIIVLTIIYGNDLWHAINNFLSGLVGKTPGMNYSFLIGGGYVLLHLIIGLFLGWWCLRLPSWIAGWSRQPGNRIVINNVEPAAMSFPSKRKRQLKTGLFIAWLVLLSVYIQSYFSIGRPLLPAATSLKILLRSIIIVLTWYFIVSPLLKHLLYGWLQKKRTRSGLEIQSVLELLPSTQQIVLESWRRSQEEKGFKRILACSKKILVNALNPVVAGKFFILTGPIQSGKTTSLVKWSEGRDDVFGILTPMANGKRVFMNVYARHIFDMEATDGEQEKLKVGRFVFSKAHFDKAIQIIRNARNETGWLLIDEIGPLELRGEGFREVLKETIAWGNEKQKIILVVREGLEEQVKQSFHISDAVVVRRVSELVGVS